jgi:ribosomal-protein-alanine N-acetyltransferase
MTPAAMAALHGAAFTMPRAWSADEFRDLLANPLVFAATEGAGGLILGRVVADEAELLTVAVDPAQRRLGLGRRLMRAFLAEARRRDATTAFLEVAATNEAAVALYASCGFARTGRRRGYYHAPDGPVDAILMGRSLLDGPEAAALAKGPPPHS